MNTYQPLFNEGALDTVEERRAAFRRLAARFGVPAVRMPSAAQRAATQEREAERSRRIEAEFRQRQAKLIEQQAEARKQVEAMSQEDKIEALFPADHFGG